MMRAKKIARLVVTLLVIYVLGGVLLYGVQEWLLFHPEALPRNHAFAIKQPYKEENITVDGKRNLSLVKFEATGTKKGLVLYFHGNMRNIERYAPFTDVITKQGYEVWMPDYPGFGKSTGKRSEEGLYKDALLVYELATKEQIPEDIIIYGRSIGTGIASYLAAHRRSREVILETPYYSMHALARYYFPIYPVSRLINYHFPTNEYLSKVRVPISILHGTEDEVVPYQQSVRLKKEHPHLVLYSIPKGKHNNLSEYPAFNKALHEVLAR
jgi:pimeloyl-ACP methyl ester carboxylesterase